MSNTGHSNGFTKLTTVIKLVAQRNKLDRPRGTSALISLGCQLLVKVFSGVK